MNNPDQPCAPQLLEWGAIPHRSDEPMTILGGNERFAADPLILMHPQFLGFGGCSQRFDRRRAPTWIYMLDSSFL